MFSLTPPTDPLAYPAWLAWLDANRLTPLAYRTLDSGLLPVDVRAHLAAAYVGSRAAWLQRKLETATLLAIFAEEPAIPVILLKGMACAISLYPDPALRLMNDVDLLVPKDRLSEGAHRLLNYGYPYGPNLESGLDTGPSHHTNFLAPGSEPPLRFEVHDSIVRLPALHEMDFLAWLWTGCETLEWDGSGASLLSPTAMLLTTSSHTMQAHGKANMLLSWLWDVDLLWRRRGQDIMWAQTVAWAQRLSWEAALHAMLTITVDYCSTPLPHEVQTWLAQDPCQLTGYEIVNRLSSPEHTRSVGVIETIRTKSMREKVHYVARMVAPDTRYMRYRYKPAHPLLLPLTYPYRWLDIAGDLVRTGYRALRRRIRSSLSQH
ncbi:MAG: nucleotidyltransferase family protein [Chloroflexi bacterium]|nr:nucleotidyltransferase family protein [Chloroflexota bacterium]